METSRLTSNSQIEIRRFQARSLPVNAYIVEAPEGAVVVDATLAVSDAKALRAQVDESGLPLLAVLITHAHPDHYGGLTDLLRGDDVPVVATAGVDRVIRRDDPVKEQILRPMFGDEWARERTFPNRTVDHNETVTFGRARFRAMDLGPGESPHDSIWILENGKPRAFVGDLVYNHMHAYLADGHYASWLASIERARAAFSQDTVFYVGHGDPATPALLDWQAEYIRTFIDAVRASSNADDDTATEQVTRVMQQYLPTDDLLFLMQLSVPPMREALAG